ncbi:MAG: DUF192 domain-containing protein [Actinomycetes bacterium]
MLDVPWLVRDGVVLASAEVATTRAERRRGLLGREHIDGVLCIQGRSVHTIGMRTAIDVAYLDGDGVVLRVETLARHRVSWPCWRARVAVESAPGQMTAWGVRPGDRLEIR